MTRLKLGAVCPALVPLACGWREADPAKSTICSRRLEDKWVWSLKKRAQTSADAVRVSVKGEETVLAGGRGKT